MTTEELDKELSKTIVNLNENWNKSGNINECFPEIVTIALDDFRKSIVEYLENRK